MDYRRYEAIHPAIPRLTEELRGGGIDRRDFLRTVTLLGLSASTAYMLAGLPRPSLAGTPKRGGTIRISMRVPDVSSPHTLPWNYGANIIRQTNDFLTRTGADNITVPWLLERWEASEDLRTWTLPLRSGIAWSNGEPLTAEHIEWNIRRWIDPAVGSSVIGLLQGFLLEEVDTGRLDAKGNPIKTMRPWREDAIEILDERTLRLNCKHPVLAVPENLFHYPAAILHPSDSGTYGVGTLGTGAFTLTRLDVGERATLERREGYWGQGPFLDRLDFIDHGDDPSAGLAAVASRQVHGLYEGSIGQYQSVQRIEHVSLHQITTAQTGVARMQVDKAPFNDPRVRKAMRLALDPERVLELGHHGLGSQGEHHHVSPIHPEYYPPEPMKQNLEEAKRLLSEAGHPNGFQTEVYCRPEPDWELATVQAMVEMWRLIGVDVKINAVPSATYWDLWTEVPFGFTSWTHRPLGTMVLALAYRTGVPWNESNYSNPEFDALLTKAEATLDIKERSLIMKDLQTIMQEDGPICQPLWRAVYTPMDKMVKGYAIHPTYYLFAEEWWLES